MSQHNANKPGNRSFFLRLRLLELEQRSPHCNFTPIAKANADPGTGEGLCCRQGTMSRVVAVAVA